MSDFAIFLYKAFVQFMQDMYYGWLDSSNKYVLKDLPDLNNNF